jgi:lipopolysaccharide transport system permease protein
MNNLESIPSATLPPPLAGRLAAREGSGEESEFPEVVIRPRSGWIAIDWKELIHFRELLYYLAWRDVKVRYKQTVLGVTWALIQPLLTMVIFTVIFGRFAGLPSAGLPYAVFVFAGLIPWTFFSTSIGFAGTSLIGQQHLMTKIYFPRLFIPTAVTCAYLVDLAITLVLYAFILAFYRVAPSWQVIFLPLLILLTLVLTLGLGFMLAALTVIYRDTRYLIPFGVQILLYLSPVIYPVNLLPGRYRWILSLNPMCGIIEGFRWSILGTPFNPASLGMAVAVSLALFAFGMYFFRRTERRFADLV